MDDIDFLPEELRARSINAREIWLNYADAQQAIVFLEAANWALLGWEGLLRYADGGIGFAGPLADIGREEGETWDTYVRRSAAICRTTTEEAQQRWTDQPERADAVLFYCLVASERAEAA